jgi:hypothetical protein
MRMLLRVSIPVEAGNAAAKAGTLSSTVEQILADLKSEAAYFFADESGQRSGSIVFDMKDTSQIPAIAKPPVSRLQSTVSLRPIMNPARPCQGRSIDWHGEHLGENSLGKTLGENSLTQIHGCSTTPLTPRRCE